MRQGRRDNENMTETRSINITKISSDTYHYLETQSTNGVVTTTVDEKFRSIPNSGLAASRESAIVAAIKDAFPETRRTNFVLKTDKDND